MLSGIADVLRPRPETTGTTPRESECSDAIRSMRTSPTMQSQRRASRDCRHDSAAAHPPPGSPPAATGSILPRGRFFSVLV
eukprot:6207384-Pleurochrysis_carterae.AAC.3